MVPFVFLWWRRGIGRGGGSCGGRSGVFGSGLVLLRGLLVAREGHVGRGLEELLPELGALPDILGMLGILFDNGKDTGGNDAVGTAKIVVDF